MRKWVLAALLCAFSLGLRAQEPYPELGTKLEEYFTALSGEPAAVQNAECDFLISSCLANWSKEPGATTSCSAVRWSATDSSARSR